MKHIISFFLRLAVAFAGACLIANGMVGFKDTLFIVLSLVVIVSGTIAALLLSSWVKKGA